MLSKHILLPGVRCKFWNGNVLEHICLNFKQLPGISSTDQWYLQ